MLLLVSLWKDLADIDFDGAGFKSLKPANAYLLV